MTNIRRLGIHNLPVFLTVVTHERKPILKTDFSKNLLLEIMREIKIKIPFQMISYVILDDHFHWIIKPCDVNFSNIMQSLKLTFARRYKQHFKIKENLILWQ